MSLEEAIKHCEEKEREQALNGCFACAEEHKQLAEWLRELQQFRKYKKWLLEEQYKRKDSLVFGDGVRYCAERLEQQFEPTDKQECPCTICDNLNPNCDCEKFDKWYRDTYESES